MKSRVNRNRVNSISNDTHIPVGVSESKSCNPTVTQNWLQTKKQEALNYQASRFINECGRWDLFR